jgi:hypothetical protein
VKRLWRELGPAVAFFVLSLVLIAVGTAGSQDNQPCHRWNYDVHHIAKARNENRPKQEFLDRVDQYAKWMTPDHVANVKRMIESAYAYEGDFLEWKRLNTLDCAGT